VPGLLPYAPRPHQEALVALVDEAVREGAHVVLESGTGTGKTVGALAGVLPAALEGGLRVVYLTRTNAQQAQVMTEFRAIRAAHPALMEGRHAVALQGRAHLCPLRREDPEFADAGAEELALMCRDARRAVDDMRDGKAPRHRPCRFYKATTPEAREEAVRWAVDANPSAEDLVGRVESGAMCPYEVTKTLLRTATLVTCPYVYFFNPNLRRALLSWMAADLGNLVIVVDEAHNLPDFARDLMSAELGRGTLERADRETNTYGNPETPLGVDLRGLLAGVDRAIAAIASEHLSGPAPDDVAEDALLPPGAVAAEILSTFRAPSPRYEKAVGFLLAYGEAVREGQRRRGRVPRSYVGAVGAFLARLSEAEDVDHAVLVERTREGESRLAIACLDPSIAARVLLDAHASVHMSGTLAPLDAYRDSIGLPSASRVASYPSPFPREHRRVLYDPTVTTRFEEVRGDPEAWPRMAARLAALRRAHDRNMAVFVPSWDVLARLAPALGRDAIVEPRGGRQEDVMRAVARFKTARGATLVSVVGGRLSEGLDFPDDTLEVVVVVGLPYPKPTARHQALVRFHDVRHGRGWDYAVVAPMTRRVLQAVGRLIRTPTDRGVAVLLDRRAALLGPAIPDLAPLESDGAVSSFFGLDNKSSRKRS